MNFNHNPLLMLDFYKVTHSDQLPKCLTKMVSYYTPRSSRLKDVDKVTFFGLQGFIQEYLIDLFNEEFFSKTEDEVVAEYNRVLTYTLGKGTYNAQKVRDLHKLGYLPLEIWAVPEGTRTKIGVPQIAITNTDPNFVWLVNTIETMLSATMWHTEVSAEVGYRYRQITDMYCNFTCDDSISPDKVIGDFSMRGQHSVESATKSSAAWLLSFKNTATVPGILWLEDNYDCNIEREPVGFGAVSTEHSVMCSNYAIDGDEETLIKRLLTEVYPHNSFSMVSDSYDYWNLVDNILPKCRKEIMAHDGTLLIRGDSGDPVEILAGKHILTLTDEEWEDFQSYGDDKESWLAEYFEDCEENEELYLQYKEHLFKVNCEVEWSRERGGITDSNYYYVDSRRISFEEIPFTSEVMGTVWALDKLFGHTINSKGYKVLDSHVKAIYGDSITPQRCEEIYRRLKEKGYAINNVVLGVGSFSFMCLQRYNEDKVEYNPYTRDTFNIAVKATYVEDDKGNPIPIFKNPKALSWKKSQKGCCIVAPDGQSFTDGHSWEMASKSFNLLRPVFKNGSFVCRQTLNEIRTQMYGK